jgi:hypothetical protein
MYYGTTSGLGRTWGEWWAGESSDPLATPGSGDIRADCYSADLNDKIIAMCRRGDPACNPGNMASLLELDYCDEYWEDMIAETGYVSRTTTVLIGGIALLAGVLIAQEFSERATWLRS